jgi:chromate reductase, NAD(P)H dehydrogenase (quinone)
MITIISGTNRKDGLTHTLSQYYFESIKNKTNETVKLLSLEDLPPDTFGSFMYGKDTLTEGFIAIEEEYMVTAEKFIFVIPEYNGSYPGILKLFIDACSVRSKMAVFKDKKAALVGVATGRAGNIRGLEHFASVMMFMGTVILPNLLPISSINKLMDTKRQIIDDGTIKAIDKQIDSFLMF